jgi:hypothetical protein
MRPSIRVAIAGLLCFSADVSAQPMNFNNDAANMRPKCLNENMVPYRIPKTDRPC